MSSSVVHPPADQPRAGSYWIQVDDHTFGPTEHVGGAWNTEEQHIAPALGLMAHVVERDLGRRRDDHLVLCRLSYDILGTLMMDEVTTTVDVLRPGRSIDLVEVVLSQRDRPAVLLRAWLMRPTATTELAATDLASIPGPYGSDPWDPTTVWPGGFIASVEVRRTRTSPGRGHVWVRTDVPLLDSTTSSTAAAAGLLDIANGMNVRADPREVAFPNLDLTAHLFRQPVGEWVGLDTTVSFGPDGQGLTSSTLHDQHGPVGALSQSLTLRPVRS